VIGNRAVGLICVCGRRSRHGNRNTRLVPKACEGMVRERPAEAWRAFRAVVCNGPDLACDAVLHLQPTPSNGILHFGVRNSRNVPVLRAGSLGDRSQLDPASDGTQELCEAA